MDFAALAGAVARTVASGRIGTPVALRAFLQISADHGRLLPALEAVLAGAEQWFGSAPTRVYALGGAKHGEITVLAEFAAGQTALVSAGVLRDPAPLADLLLVGNRGTLRLHEALDLGVPGPPHQWIRAAVERSLSSAAPVEVAP